MAKKKNTAMSGEGSSSPQQPDASVFMAGRETEATVPQIELVDIRLIKENLLNPRKAFDEALLAGLAGNIRQQGLLQPITVRKLDGNAVLGPEELAGKNMYEIVCGARRYRACKILGMKTVACIVRVMSDEDAFDAMITENLQRKDVEPMDEAVAFAELHKRGVSIEELGARFGKSIAFITQRIRLNEIIPEFASMLEKKELQVSHALELCKLNPDEQKDIYEHCYGEDAKSWNRWNDYSVKKLKEGLQCHFCELEDAPFDKAECKTCQYNCACNSLFEEMEGCSNPRCFNRKKMENRAREVEEEIGRGAIFIAASNPDPEKDTLIKILGEKGIEPFESGVLKPAVMTGYWGEERLVYVKEKNGVDLAGLPLDDSLAVKELEAKDKRNLELKDEKIVSGLRDLFSKSGYEANTDDLTEVEERALRATILIACGSGYRDHILGPDESGIMDVIAGLDVAKIRSMLRSFIKVTVTDSAVTWSKARQSILKHIALIACPEESKAIIEGCEATYRKRKDKISGQIEVLVVKNTAETYGNH